ncbi:hypothetical protein, partial [Allosphingosinicella sp.]|uniref:hypothetical protein n=1 Tax=Allosphingosinicella sp. TaxID=2823234 RepID=UPI002F0C7B93
PAAELASSRTSPLALSLSKGWHSSCGEGGSAGLRQAQPERDCANPNAHSRWHRALAIFRRAEARLADFRRYEASLPAAARAFPACEPLEERFNDLESARLASLRRLLRAPAPDLPALALKIALAIEEEIAFFSGGEACLAAVKADAQRLCRIPSLNSSV